VKEARRMGVPVVSVVDTNCDPDRWTGSFPGNDDALRAIRLFTSKISDAVHRGRHAFTSSLRLPTRNSPPTSHEAGVEYVDTSAYEQYEKQEGDFVEAQKSSPKRSPKPPCRPNLKAAVAFHFSGPRCAHRSRRAISVAAAFRGAP
jgi:ribosomal protein S2